MCGLLRHFDGAGSNTAPTSFFVFLTSQTRHLEGCPSNLLHVENRLEYSCPQKHNAQVLQVDQSKTRPRNLNIQVLQEAPRVEDILIKK
jgi:hypothetical protein